MKISILEFAVLRALSDGDDRPENISEGDWETGVEQCSQKGWLTEDLQLTDQAEFALMDDFAESHLEACGLG